MKAESVQFYDREEVAERYQRRGGFAPQRKAKMLEVALNLLLALTPANGRLLELGAGTGLFTQQLMASGHFSHIRATDGAKAMLQIARQNLAGDEATLQFEVVEFSTAWAGRYAAGAFDAVTSTMAIHHAPDKERLFHQIFQVLKPAGVLVVGDHVRSSSAVGQYLIDRERAVVALGGDRGAGDAAIRQKIEIDKQVDAREGNRCEPVSHYLAAMAACGFEEIACLWRDFWLAVFVARKPAVAAP